MPRISELNCNSLIFDMGTVLALFYQKLLYNHRRFSNFHKAKQTALILALSTQTIMSYDCRLIEYIFHTINRHIRRRNGPRVIDPIHKNLNVCL